MPRADKADLVEQMLSAERQRRMEEAKTVSAGATPPVAIRAESAQSSSSSPVIAPSERLTHAKVAETFDEHSDPRAMLAFIRLIAPLLASHVWHPNVPTAPYTGRYETLLAALRPFAAMVHEDGDEAPYPEEKWSPLLIAAKRAVEEAERVGSGETAPDWQPIETAPKDGTEIDVWCPSEVQRLTVKWDGEVWENVRGGWVSENYPSHWMPFPSPPTSGER